MTHVTLIRKKLLGLWIEILHTTLSMNFYVNLWEKISYVMEMIFPQQKSSECHS